MATSVSNLTGASVRTRFPELLTSDYSDDALSAALATAKTIYNLGAEGVLHLAAHIAVLNRSENKAAADGGSGTVMQEQIGPKMATYAVQARKGGDVFYERTSYGRLFMAIRDSSAKRNMPFVAT